MKIKKIHLRNFKNFEDVTVELGDMNVLIGANASGKSNFLSALKFLRDIQQFGMEDAVSLQGGIEYIGRFGMKEGDEIVIGMEVELDYRSNNIFGHNISEYQPMIYVGTIWETAYYEVIIRFKALQKYVVEESVIGKCAALLLDKYTSGHDIKAVRDSQPQAFFKFDFKLIRNSTDNLAIFLDDDRQLDVPYKNQIIKTTLRHLRPFIHFSNEDSDELIIRVIRNESLSLQQISIYDFDPKLIKQPTSMLSKAKLEENGSNLAVVLKKLLANPEKSKSLIRMTKYLLPFVTNVMVEKSLNKSLQFSINEIHNADVNLPNFLLSDGTVTAMATLVGLAYEANKVVIFEEPERGIHPELISSLMGLFYDITTETRKKQVIITTHNPTWLNHAKVEDILIFERNKQGTCEISTIKDREMVKKLLKKGLMIGNLFAHNSLNS